MLTPSPCRVSELTAAASVISGIAVERIEEDAVHLKLRTPATSSGVLDCSVGKEVISLSGGLHGCILRL